MLLEITIHRRKICDQKFINTTSKQWISYSNVHINKTKESFRENLHHWIKFCSAGLKFESGACRQTTTGSVGLMDYNTLNDVNKVITIRQLNTTLEDRAREFFIISFLFSRQKNFFNL